MERSRKGLIFRVALIRLDEMEAPKVLGSHEAVSRGLHFALVSRVAVMQLDKLEAPKVLGSHGAVLSRGAISGWSNISGSMCLAVVERSQENLISRTPNGSM